MYPSKISTAWSSRLVLHNKYVELKFADEYIQLHWLLFSGLTLVVIPKFSFTEYLKSIVKYKITHLLWVYAHSHRKVKLNSHLVQPGSSSSSSLLQSESLFSRQSNTHTKLLPRYGLAFCRQRIWPVTYTLLYCRSRTPLRRAHYPTRQSFTERFDWTRLW